MIQTGQPLRCASSLSVHYLLTWVALGPILTSVQTTTNPMRKIEEQMCNAVHHNIDWHNANTSVTYCEDNGESKVYLHGNHIATVGDDFLQIFDGGWQSNTTKSRLNALINRFCNGLTDGVHQKDFSWFIRDNNVTRDFENGYIFA